MLSRRSLLLSLGGLALLGVSARYGRHFLPSSFEALNESPDQKFRYLVAGHADMLPNKGSDLRRFFSPDVPGFVMAYDLHEQRVKKMPIPLHVHHFFPSPTNSNLIAGCVRWGPRAVLFDLHNETVLQNFVPKENYRFFGHGVFSADGSKLFFSANDNDNKNGCVLIYETASGKFLGDVATGGLYPHECFWKIPDQELIISNLESGADPTISEVITLNVNTGKISDRIPVRFATHLLSLDQNLVAVGSSNFKKNLATWNVLDLQNHSNQGNFSEVYNLPDLQLMGEALSQARLNDSTILTTNNMGRMVFAWDWERKKFSHEMMSGRTLGVSVLDKDIFVTVGITGGLHRLRFDSESFRFTQKEKLTEAFANGSHLSKIRT